MRNSVPSPPRSYVERFSTVLRCFLLCVVQLTAAGGALAQNARTPPSDPATTSPYVVDGLALGARIDAGSPAYRGYQCSPSEQFPDFNQAKILSIRVMRDDWPAQRSCAGYDLPRETGIEGLWCVGDAVKQYGNGGTQACAETAKIVTDAILAQRQPVPLAGSV